MFVWLTFTGRRWTTVIAGCEAAWAFFGGVFADADPGQHVGGRRPGPTRSSRGSTTGSSSTPRPAGSSSTPPGCAARRTSRGSSGRVSMCGRILRRRDVPRPRPTPQRRAEAWCRDSGRACGSTARPRPARPRCSPPRRHPVLLPAPAAVTTCRCIATAEGRTADHHVEVGKALYSVPGESDRAAGRRPRRPATGEDLLPRAARQGPSRGSGPGPAHRPGRPARRARPRTRCGTSTALQRRRRRTATSRRLRRGGAGHPLPWTKMRQVYALLGLVRSTAPTRSTPPARRALDAEAVNVGLIGRMLDPRHRRRSGRDPGTARGGVAGSSATAPTSPVPARRRQSTPADRPRGQHPAVSRSGRPELKALLRRVKLGRCSTPSPNGSRWPAPRLPHAEFLELSSPTRSPAATTSAALRARAAGSTRR